MSEEMTQTAHSENPAWFDGKKINEALFCEEFLREYPMVTVNGAFFTVNGRVHDENRLKKVIYDRIKYYVTSGIAKKVANLLDVMRMECCTEKLPLYQDRIHVANGTYYLNGTFSPEKNFCRNRLPVSYNPEAPQPVTWLHFLSQLLEPEDILTLQEFNIYKVLIYFDKLYAVMSEQEKRQIMEALISEIQIYEERQPNGQWLKSIKFKLPIIEEDMSLSLDNDEHVESVVRLERHNMMGDT